MLCVQSFDGKNVVHSWHPRAMNAPIAKLNSIFFEQLSMRSIREVRLTNRVKYLKQFLFSFYAQYISSFCQ